MKVQYLVYPPVLTSLAVLFLFVLAKNSGARINKVFSLFIATILSWLTLSMFADLSTNPAHGLFFIRTAYLLSIPIPFVFVIFAYIFPGNKPLPKLKIALLAIPTAVLMVMSYSALNITEIVLRGWGVDVTKSGIVYLLSSIYFFGYIIFASVLFIRKLKTSEPAERNQIRLIIFGTMFVMVANVITNYVLVILGYSEFGVIIGNTSFLVFVGILTYAIIKHKLFDIRLFVARSVAYILLLVSLTGIYVLGAFGVTTLAFNNQAIATGQELVFVVLAIVLAFIFQPLRRFFERITDKIFFRDKYDSQQLLNDITQVLAQEIDLQKVLDKTLTMIAQAVRVNFGQYLIFEEGKVYKVEHYGKLPERLITTPELKVLNRAMLVADELEAGNRKDVMDTHGIRLSLALRTKDEFVGFLLLGDKLSGDIYSTQDIELFQILANELAVAIVNAKAYEEIARFNITLQDKVNQATSRLRVANHNLKELDKAKDEFISMASHQLRTPLTTIKGYISMLQEGDAGKVSKEQDEFLGFAYDGSERMVGLISDLLNVSRMNSGKFMIDRASVDPVAMVSGEVRQLQSHADAKKLKLVWTPPKTKLPSISIDEGKTRQVIMNFIDNAIYYTRAGSVTVTLKQLGDQLELRVSDTGIGVPEAARAKLFKKFFRAGNAQQLRPDGTGLGLYLAKRVVEDQGGKILFESTEGKGSMFGFSLPYKTPVAPTPKLPNPASKPITKVAVSS